MDYATFLITGILTAIVTYGATGMSFKACMTTADIALAAEQYDSEAAEVFYQCNTTKGEKNELCKHLGVIADQSETNHKALVAAAQSCLGSVSTSSGPTNKKTPGTMEDSDAPRGKSPAKKPGYTELSTSIKSTL